MTLYYQDDHVTLYHGDCIGEHQEWVTADVLVTDPPYGVAFQSGMRKGERLATIANDGSAAVRDAAVAAWGAGRPAVVFGSWRVPPPCGGTAASHLGEGWHPGHGRSANAVGHQP